MKNQCNAKERDAGQEREVEGERRWIERKKDRYRGKREIKKEIEREPNIENRIEKTRR